ncbi:hypothetical protein [Ferrimonas marina]|uniref:Uncharacterized protein n=1 Tax=Ferrimonas marina TaxID=299255 RepID=A0A1M5YA05_9GAMM|nr:hypothetical protein [Ferrimonas marina]SHI08877.1 hypothetical protein SAMN02745129_3998 [Ferrimonas marina]
MRPDTDLRRTPLSVWIAVIYWPLGLQMLFWMMGFHYVDFSLPGSLMELPATLLRYYVSVTLLLYPAFFAYGLFYSLHLNRSGAPASKVMLASLLPFVTAAPYLLTAQIMQYFQ